MTRGVKVKPFQHLVSAARPHDGDYLRAFQTGLATKRGHSFGNCAAAVADEPGRKYNSHSKLNCVTACLQAEQAWARMKG
jgi:branched-chain amino acid aminotransferase